MITDSAITVILLAGGKSSRMGQDKGLMLLNGKPMIEYIIEIAQQISTEIIIVANNDSYLKFNLPVFKDEFLDKGPLAGIYTGLKNTKTEKNLILSCDVPYIQKELIEFLISNSEKNEITISLFQDKLHPLIGIYAKSCLPVILEQIKLNELKVASLFEKIKTKLLNVNEFDSSNFRNINKESDL